MATRSRTLLFLQFRNSYSGSHAAAIRQQYNQQQQQHQQSSLLATSDGYGDTERVGLMDSAETAIELMMLPPKWYDNNCIQKCEPRRLQKKKKKKRTGPTLPRQYQSDRYCDEANAIHCFSMSF
jgi:hypothetical protein